MWQEHIYFYCVHFLPCSVEISGLRTTVHLGVFVVSLWCFSGSLKGVFVDQMAFCLRLMKSISYPFNSVILILYISYKPGELNIINGISKVTVFSRYKRLKEWWRRHSTTRGTNWNIHTIASWQSVDEKAIYYCVLETSVWFYINRVDKLIWLPYKD